MEPLNDSQAKFLKKALKRPISEQVSQKHSETAEYLEQIGLLEQLYRPLTESELTSYPKSKNNVFIIPPVNTPDGYKITAAGRAVLRERGKSDRRWRITTGIAWAALSLSAITIIWQILERLFEI